MIGISRGRRLARIRNAFLGATALAGVTALATPASAIVINDNFTPTQAVDTTNITGVGQMVIDEQNGFIGLCTVSLINPRTVLFASHCVNENPNETAFQPGTAYGSANGGMPIGFFFNANNNQAGNSAIGHWLNGVAGGQKYLTNITDNAYNSNFVVYNTNCCTIGLGNNFLQADVAMAALDTPVVGMPTFTTLFSPLTAPAHATITGYGDNGIGSTGQGTIDFKRRVAENIVSVLGSLDDQDNFLFGAPDGLPQNLYMMDFNDPKFGTAQANVFDFDIFHDTATTREGITAPGDSGGPLIIDHQFTAPTIAGVLSGGDRFFNAQKGASYGTTSFYQPLYLYWDWIVANNPYKYVSAVAGDGNWTDAAHWQMDLDPAYMTIDSGGNLVNGLPSTPATGTANTAPGFGTVCYFDDCIDIKTGVHTNPTPAPGPNPTSGARPFGGLLGVDGFDSLVQSYIASQNGSGGAAPGNLLSGGPEVVSSSIIDGGISGSPAVVGGGAIGSILSPDSSPQSDWTNPEGSSTAGGVSVQGAPGSALGGVPNDTAGSSATDAPARYYDVTLGADGITTLSGAAITIDRLTINGANAGLTITSGASLASLINTNIFDGNLQVDGTYSSAGDIQLFGGLLSGTGTVTAPNVVSATGMIAPGTVGTVGTLSINGGLTLTGGSALLLDVTTGSADKLLVSGTANLDGFLVASLAPGNYAWGTQFTVLTAGAVSGTFATGMFSGVAFGSAVNVTYNATNVFLTVQAAPFTWGTTPGTGDWNTAGNWIYGVVPSAADDAYFSNTTISAITIGAPSAARSLNFDPGAPAYSFTITGSASGAASLTLSQGIVNMSGNTPSFSVSGIAGDTGTLAFTGIGTAVGAPIAVGAFGIASFSDMTDAGATVVFTTQSGGLIDFSTTTGAANDGNVNAGSIDGGADIKLGANILTTGGLDTSTDIGGVISGSGGLTKTGSGILTLSGDNTYTGTTTISAGGLKVGNGGTSGLIAGDIADDTALAFDRSDASTYGGVISGTGVVVQLGTGTTVLTGDSTNTGLLQIAHGTLQLGNGGTTGSIANTTVFDLATLAFDRSDSVTFAADIVGAGGNVTQIGTGTTILTGNNSYDGTTTISAGTLQIGNGGTAGTLGSGAVIDNGTLALDRSDNILIANQISGSGALQQIGSGLTFLTADNTYTGGTTITAGGLSLGNGGTTGSVVGYIADGGALAFDRSNTLTYGGVISGTGVVVQLGTGTTVLTGNSTNTGIAQIAHGTLQLGNGGTTGSIANTTVFDLSNLAFNRSDTFTVAGDIAGVGGTVAQIGTGTTVLTGNNTYTGTTTISAGTLQIGSGGTAGTLGSGAVVDNATLAFDRSDSILVANMISGSGALRQIGGGLTFLTADDTYTGGTTITAGGLALGNGGTTGSVVGNIADGGALAFDRSNTLTYGGVISGTGVVVQLGTGTTVLTGTNTNTGILQIAHGTLQLGNGGTTGSIANTTVFDLSNLAFDRSDTVTFGAAIVGAGGNIAQIGTGKTILTGANSYDGTTTISAGTLQIGNGGTTGTLGSGAVIDNAALVFNHSDNLLVANAISGTGTLTQAGTGVVGLTGANTYSGLTTISSGTLQIGNAGTSGSLGTGAVVDNGALVFNRSDNITVANLVSGTGTLMQAGGGTLTLTADNTYSGLTTAGGGGLALGNGGTTGSVAGNIAVTSALAFDRSNTLTYGGVLSGTGIVVQLGTGTTVLTGTNTNTGALQIAHGTLQLGNGGTTGSIASTTVFDLSNLAFDRSDTVTFAANISGAGGNVAQIGTGKTILTGTNSYTGTTTISAGTLQIGNGGTSGTLGSGAVVDNGALVFNRSDNVLVASAISGSGTLTQAGTGVVGLTGANTYSGGTTISAGTLQVGNAGTSGTLGTGPVVDNAMLIFNRTDSYTFGGAISGTGSLGQAGTGTTILTGAGTYTGGTIIAAGRLQLGNGGTTGSIVGNVADGGTFAINRSDAVTFAGVISGPGAFNQAGTGSTILTAANTYTGGTAVNAGALTVTGSIGSSAVTVASGTSLFGTGTVGSTTIASGGTLAAGTIGTIGTLTVNGNLTFGSGANFLVDTTGPLTDKVAVSGVIAAAGTVTLTGIGGYVPHFGDSGVIATAADVTGGFAAVSDNINGVLKPTVVVITVAGGKQVVYQIVADSLVAALGAGASADQLTIATALDADRTHYADLAGLYQAIDPLTGAALGQALEDLAPDAERAAELVGDMTATGFDNMLWQHLGDTGPAGTQTAGLQVDRDGLKLALSQANATTPGAQQFMALGQGIATNPGGGNDPIATTGTAAAASPSAAEGMWLPGGASGFLSGSALQGTVGVGGGGGTADVRGMVLGGGIDMPVGNGFTVGVSLGYSDATAALRSAPASLQANAIQGALYARYDIADNWSAEAFGAYGHQTMTTRRLAVVGGTTFSLTGHTGGDTPSFGALVGRSFRIDTNNGAALIVKPSLSLQYVGSQVDAFTETGGPAAMTFAGFSDSSLLSRLGIDAKMTFDAWGAKLTPNVHAAWVDNFEGTNGTITAGFAAAPAAIMTFAPTARDRSYGEMGLGLDLDMSDVLGTDATLSGRYDGNTRSDVNYGAWTGRLTVRF
jgi:fibronectin-binding autotransporter adhesin